MPGRSPALAFSVLGADGVDSWTRLMSQGFGLAEARSAYFRAAVGAREIRLVGRGGRIVGTGALLPMAQYFGGRPVPVAGLAAVTVAPGERGHGIATALVRSLMTEARGRGLALAVLYAATLPLYQRLGFARAGVSIDYELSVARTLSPLFKARRRQPWRMSHRAAIDWMPLAALRRNQAQWCNGLVERPPLLWANLLTPSEAPAPELQLILGGDGRPHGYVLVHHPADGRTVRLVDSCLLSGEAVQQVLGFLAVIGQRPQTVVWPGGPDDPLAHLAPEVEVGVDDWMPWLVRVLDVPGALAARGYPRGLAVRLDLEIEDAVLPANHGRWRLTVADGAAVVEPRPLPAANAPVLTLPIASLAPLLTGHLTAPALRALSWVAGSDAAVETAALVFGGPAPWLADRF
jgi:predicted acetyltransferase